jgi:glycosyltransferase involved in cell wall biosynthesis
VKSHKPMASPGRIANPGRKSGESGEVTQRQRACLVVAYHFPPLAAAGTHRTRAMVRHLPAQGWMPIVVTVKPSPSEPVDPTLLAGLPNDLVRYETSWTSIPSTVARVRRLFSRSKKIDIGTARLANGSLANEQTRGGWSDWLSWWWHVPDTRLGWFPYGVLAGYRAIRRHRCRAIYTTSPYWTSQLIGLALHRLTGLPWVADFRDPWRPNPFRQFPYAGPDRYDAWLERQVVRHADRVVCNTPGVQRTLEERYPDLSDRFVTILNGIEPEDFRDLRPSRLAPADCFVITHTGDFYGKRRPDPILAGLKLLRERDPATAARVRLQLVGPSVCDGEPLGQIVASYGLSDLVSITGPVPQQKTREILAGSDALLLLGFIGPGSELQAPSKLYEYLAIGKPVLALSARQTAIAAVLDEIGGEFALCNPHDPAAIAEAIRRLALAPKALAMKPIPEKMTRAYQARQLAELLGRHAPVAGWLKPKTNTVAGFARIPSGIGTLASSATGFRNQVKSWV